MFNLQKLDRLDIAYLYTQYLSTLTRPVDGFWERAVLSADDYFLVSHLGQKAGFVSCSPNGCLHQLYLLPPFKKLGRKLLVFLRDNGWCHTASASTGDPFTFSLCLDFAKQTLVHTFLFEDSHLTSLLPRIAVNATLVQASHAEQEEIIQFYAMHTKGDKLWFRNYVGHYLSRDEIWLLNDARGNLLALGECRLSDLQPGIADLGVVVAFEHRRNHLGAYLLQELKKIAYAVRRSPICSCKYDNTGSRKAIESAGFIGSHRMVTMVF